MNVDANKVIDKLVLEIAQNKKEIAILRVQNELIVNENEQLRAEKTKA